MYKKTKLSDFITKLQKLKEKHGDIDMCGNVILKVYCPKTNPEIGMNILLPPCKKY